MSKDKYSLKSLTKETLIDIIARLEWEVDCWKEKEINSRYFEKQVVEKEKEIDMLKSQNQFFMEETKRLNQIVSIQRNDKSIRHQVCQEIKETLSEFCGYDLDNNKWVITEEMFKYLIDQIEKGERDETHTD